MQVSFLVAKPLACGTVKNSCLKWIERCGELVLALFAPHGQCYSSIPALYVRNQCEKDRTGMKSFLIPASVWHDMGLPLSLSCFTQIIISQLSEQYSVDLKIHCKLIIIVASVKVLLIWYEFSAIRCTPSLKIL